MAKKVKPGDTVLVSVKLEFENTVYSHMISVENQQILTTNNAADDFPIKLNGEPITIIGSFRGEPNSKVTKFDVTINGLTKKVKDLDIDREIEVRHIMRYAFFGLEHDPIKTPIA